MSSHPCREPEDSPPSRKPRPRHPRSIGLCLFPFVLTSANICELDLSSNQGNTTNLMFIPSWSWLQMTVQTTTYSPGSLGAATVNSWVPGLTRKIHDFRNTEGLAMVQIRYRRGFETKNEAFT